MDTERLTTESLIPPNHLKRFLGVNNWAIAQENQGEWEVWRAPEGIYPTFVRLVHDREYFDYDTRLFEANQAIREAYRLSSLDLTERISALSADLLFFRIDQFSPDGTIPFKQAQRALEGIASMVRAAATTTVNPQHSHKGRRPAVVDEFLAEKLRLGHTKKGSFVVTAVARFDELESAAPVDSESQGTSEESAPDFENPFGRRVMATLSRGLTAAREVATGELPIGTAIERGLSLEMLEALENVTEEVGLRAVDVSFDWSPAVPVPDDVAISKVIKFDQEVISSLPEVSRQLQIREEPRVVEVVGPVVALARSHGDAEESSGQVTIRAEVDGKDRKINVELDGIEHDAAIRAYRERIPVIVHGTLVKRKSWQLEGNVRLDVRAVNELLRGRVRRLEGYVADSIAPAVDPGEIEGPAPTD